MKTDNEQSLPHNPELSYYNDISDALPNKKEFLNSIPNRNDKSFSRGYNDGFLEEKKID